jgi:uncharacterized protein with HEPN domain
MIECCKNIFEYTKGINFDNFMSDRKTIDAIIRNFEVLGEAAKRISEDVRLSNTEIEWRRIGDFRSVIIHDYFGINYNVVWKIRKEYLPQQFHFLKELSAALS